MQSKRHRRRNRYRLRQKLRQADAIAERRIHNNFALFGMSWGGSRCPDCGQGIRPHQLVDCSITAPGLFIDGFYANHSGCIENPHWERKAWARAERVHKYRLRMGVDDGWR
jgi:hypothetical protein